MHLNDFCVNLENMHAIMTSKKMLAHIKTGNDIFQAINVPNFIWNEGNIFILKI